MAAVGLRKGFDDVVVDGLESMSEGVGEDREPVSFKDDDLRVEEEGAIGRGFGPIFFVVLPRVVSRCCGLVKGSIGHLVCGLRKSIMGAY